MDKRLIFIIVVLISAVSISSVIGVDKIKIGGQTIRYDNVSTYGNMTSYYLNDSLVLSTFDNNGDGKADQWFIYGDGFTLQSAMQDSDYNGGADYFVAYNPTGDVISERVSKSFFENLWDAKFYIAGVIVLALIVFLLFKLSKRHKHHKKKQEKKEK